MAGCGGGGQGPASCDGGCWHPTAADEAYAVSFCALTSACCARNDVQPDAGVQTYADLCSAKILRAGFSRDPSLRSACLAELQQVAASDACLPDYSNLGSSCMRAFYEPSGPLAPGQRCTGSADCAGRAGAVTICQHLSDRSVCLSVVPGRAGDHPCLGDVYSSGVLSLSPYLAGSPMTQAFTGSYCASADGLYCTFSNVPAEANICTPFFADGAACLYPRTCASGSCLRSDGSQNNGSAPGTCGTTVPPANGPTGSPCMSDTDCASGNCDGNQGCAALSHAQKLAQLALCTPI